MIHPGGGKLDVGEHAHQRRGLGGIGQREAGIALAQDLLAVRADEAYLLVELANTGAPAVHHANFGRGNGDLGNADHAEHSHEDQVSGGFLPDIFDEERALEVRQNSIRSHVKAGKFPVGRKRVKEFPEGIGGGGAS